MDPWRALALRSLAAMASRGGWYDFRALHPAGCAIHQLALEPDPGKRPQACDCGVDACTDAFRMIEHVLARREAPLPDAISDDAFVAALIDRLHTRLEEARAALRELVAAWPRCHEAGCRTPATHEAPAADHPDCVDYLCREHAEGAAGATPLAWSAALERASQRCG